MGFFTTMLNVVIVASGTGLGVALGQALFHRYLKDRIIRLPNISKEQQVEANSGGLRNITVADLKEFIKKLEDEGKVL